MKSYKVMLLLTITNVALVAGAWFGIVSARPGSAAQSAPTSDVLRAKAFEVVNDDGKVVAQLQVGADGSGDIRLRTVDGIVGVKLGADPDGAGLILFKDAEPAVWARTNDDGTKLTLAEEGQKRVIRP